MFIARLLQPRVQREICAERALRILLAHHTSIDEEQGLQEQERPLGRHRGSCPAATHTDAPPL